MLLGRPKSIPSDESETASVSNARHVQYITAYHPPPYSLFLVSLSVELRRSISINRTILQQYGTLLTSECNLN
jgi:hypothetical protein